MLITGNPNLEAVLIMKLDLPVLAVTSVCREAPSSDQVIIHRAMLLFLLPNIILTFLAKRALMESGTFSQPEKFCLAISLLVIELK